jgi:hypothetical protein
MPSSLIPEKPLVISPSLAATIGLEEAVMLQQLHDRSRYEKPRLENGYRWFSLDLVALHELFPFWQAGEVQRVAGNLRDQGILLLGGEVLLSSGRLDFALNEKVVAAVEDAAAGERVEAHHKPTVQQHFPAGRESGSETAIVGPHKMFADWQPDPEIIRQIERYGISGGFINDMLPEFVSYWLERGEAHHSWGARYLKWVVRKWREEETLFAARQQASSLGESWQPSEDAMEILQQAGIQPDFARDAIPEFVLYWRERGESSSTWNSKFVQHVKRQWARYCQSLQYDTEPRAISRDWKPGRDVYDVLALANIDAAFADSLVPEFVLYWLDSGQLASSWNTKFLQHVKYHWARRHKMQMNDNQQTAEQDFVQLHTDRSWADGL